MTRNMLYWTNLKERGKQIISLALDYRKRFELDSSLFKNCVFARQMRAFINYFRDYKNSETEKEVEAFHQKVIHIMTEGGTQTQWAILEYLYHHSASKVALAVILKLNIPEEDKSVDWVFSDEMIKAVKAAIAEE